ncbi:MAG: diguanylate cyclase [Gemmatimonadota bacterium]
MDCSILIVDDDPLAIAVLARILDGFGRLRFATNGADALRLARVEVPTLVLLDVEMPEMSGLDVCAAMKADPVLHEVPVMFITSHDDTAREVAGLTAGAVDFISKPPTPVLVQARVRTQLRLQQMASALREAAMIDGLTQVANRRRFDETLPREWLRSLRGRTPLAVLMIDVDHFKAYNDCYGHPAGDRALQAVARTLREVVRRPADLLARYGGEEFVLLAPEQDITGATGFAARLLDAVQQLAYPHAASPVAPHLTISIGISVHDAHCGGLDHSTVTDLTAAIGQAGRDAGELVLAADRALYAAKQAGRRRAAFLAMERAGDPTAAVTVRVAGETGPTSADALAAAHA